MRKLKIIARYGIPIHYCPTKSQPSHIDLHVHVSRPNPAPASTPHHYLRQSIFCIPPKAIHHHPIFSDMSQHEASIAMSLFDRIRRNDPVIKSLIFHPNDFKCMTFILDEFVALGHLEKIHRFVYSNFLDFMDMIHLAFIALIILAYQQESGMHFSEGCLKVLQ